jgi:hypothetical protein
MLQMPWFLLFQLAKDYAAHCQQHSHKQTLQCSARCCSVAVLLHAPFIPGPDSSKVTPCLKQKKPIVAVPHFKNKAATSSTSAAADKLAGLPRRRPAQQILAGMAAEAEQAWGRGPLPTGD